MRKRGFALSLGLPEDATSDCARVTLSGQSAALVEGQHGVIELTESRVRLRTGRGVLTVQGEGLRLRCGRLRLFELLVVLTPQQK